MIMILQFQFCLLLSFKGIGHVSDIYISKNKIIVYLQNITIIHVSSLNKPCDNNVIIVYFKKKKLSFRSNRTNLIVWQINEMF